MTRPPLITLTTDFGGRDSYVAEMKGVLFSRGPTDLRVVDLTHEIGAQDVTEAALFLKAAATRFPDGTVHLVVVDPGVGSARHPVAVRTRRFLLVGPDNGVFTHLLDGSETAYAIDPAKVSSGPVSATFHGRDVFAPAAALLAAGTAPERLGTPVSSPLRLRFPKARTEGNALRGEVIHVDRFGNLITSITRKALDDFLKNAVSQAVRVEIGGKDAGRFLEHYAQASVHQALALVGSTGFLEIAVRQASAAERFGAERGAPVVVKIR